MSLQNLTSDDIKMLSLANIDYQKCKILNYKTKQIFFYDILAEAGKDQKDSWASYTGLTTNRPSILVDIISKNNCFFENMKILDIGCGLSELGMELSTRYNNIEYDGIEIIDNLIQLNKINLPEYNFTKLNIMDSKCYPELLKFHSKDIICALGIPRDFDNCFKYIIDNISPQFIILETHSGYLKDMEQISSICKSYKIICKEQYTFYNNCNNKLSLNEDHQTWNRIVIILQKDL